MAALNAGGYETSTVSGVLKDAVRAQIAATNPPVLSELKNFLTTHKRSDPAANLAQYISFGLSVVDPPEFQTRFREGEIPPDVMALEGFQALMIRFHREARIDELWRKSQPLIEREIARYQEPVSRAVFEVNGYLRNPTSGYMGRRFQVYLDLLGPPSQVHTRSYADDYFVVLSPALEPQYDDIRHAYLHYLLDPLSIKFSEQIMKKRGLGDYAQAAPTLAEHFKSDFLLLTTECLIKAIESRLVKATPEQRQAMVQEAFEDGFVLTPYFAEKLPSYEKQESAMRLYLPDMVSEIDLKKEDKRLEHIQFATKRRPGKIVTEAREGELTSSQKKLDEAEGFYVARKLEQARESYLGVLRQTEDKSLHARAYYGLGRIAALQKNPELAEKLFRKTLELAPDPQTKSWTQVYLGRLADIAGERDQAAQYYQAALAVEGASPAAKDAAQKGLKNGFQKDQNKN